MILTHGANSLPHGFTPKPIPTGFTRVYGVKSACRIPAFALDISSLGLTNQDLESVMECYITPFENKPYDQRPYSTNDVCPWCNSTIRLFTVSESSQYNIYLINGGGSYQSTFSTTDTSFGGRKRITVKNNRLDINGAVYTCDARGYAVANVTGLHLWGPFDNDIYTPITIYEVTVKKGDTIYAHLVPVRDESTGHPNFFDEVSGRVMNPELGPTWTEWNEFEILDGVVIGGRMYPTVQMPDGNIWLAQNLDYAWEGLTVGSSSYSRETQLANYYDNDENTYGWNGKKCGLLYNAVAKRYLETNKTLLIPGWHVASQEEWAALVTSVGDNPGTKLKAANNSIDGNWPTGWNRTDDYGFSALPAGWRTPDSYADLNSMAKFWTSSVVMTNYDRTYYLNTGSTITRDYNDIWESYSIRLVKDAT